MSVTATREIVKRAFDARYGVAAVNIVNDLTLEAVLAAAEEVRAPLIVQTSVKTVKSIGVGVLFAMWRAMTSSISVPVALHLDHCSDRAVIDACLEAGWNSVLFDASGLSVEENRRHCIEVVAAAHRLGAAVEGEIEGIRGAEDGVGSDAASEIVPLDVAVDFIRSTGVDVFAPSIGNSHGVYRTAPTLDVERVSELVARTGLPMALHGGTGLTGAQFADLISRGCAKVNISTALKVAFTDATREYLEANPDAYDPPSQFRHVRAAIVKTTIEHIRMFGSDGKAW